MSNEVSVKIVDPMQDFQNKVTEKIRNDIGQLLPKEVVDGLFNKAVNEHFFKPRIIQDTNWSSRTTEIPSWFVQAVADASQPILEQAIKEYVKNNEAVIKKAMDEFLSTQNLTLLTCASLAQQMNNQVYQVVEQIMSRLTNR